MISELRRGFEIGFLIVLPFLVIDLIVATLTMSMGMMMLPPTVISLPFKILFFVLIDGWNLLDRRPCPLVFLAAVSRESELLSCSRNLSRVDRSCMAGWSSHRGLKGMMPLCHTGVVRYVRNAYISAGDNHVQYSDQRVSHDGAAVADATNKQLEITQARIATGFSVATAADNAAYWSIATTMRSDNKALSTVQDALGLGAAKVDVAYTGINAAIDVVDEIKAKLVAAREPGVDKSKIQSEITALQSAADQQRRRGVLQRRELAVGRFQRRRLLRDQVDRRILHALGHGHGLGQHDQHQHRQRQAVRRRCRRRSGRRRASSTASTTPPASFSPISRPHRPAISPSRRSASRPPPTQP